MLEQTNRETILGQNWEKKLGYSRFPIKDKTFCQRMDKTQKEYVKLLNPRQ